MNRRKTSIVLLLVMTAGALSAHVLTPTISTKTQHPPLRDSIPMKFGRWSGVSDPVAQVALTTQEANQETETTATQPVYDEVVTRTYQRDDGARVMLAVAYGSQQRQERKIHRPELCYYAQGFKISPLGASNLPLSAKKHFKVRQLLTRKRSRIEPVTYWIRIDDRIVWNQLQTRWAILNAGMQQRIPDGILVRASSLIHDETGLKEALALQQSFLIDLYSSTSSTAKGLLTGT